MSHLKSLLRFFLLSTPLISGVWAEEVMTSTQEIEIPYFDQKISIDGRMNEKIWQQARKIELNIETSPANNKPAPVKTTAYLFENGTHLYIAFDAKDPDPQNIRAFYRDRDKIFADDNVGINIDPSNKRNLAFEFFSNALGVQLDLTEDDLNKKESSSWDGIWDSAGQINEHGFIDADRNYQVPNKPGFFVCGDVVRPHLLTTAIGQAGIVAESIGDYLAGKDQTARPKVDVHYFDLMEKLNEWDLAPSEEFDLKGTPGEGTDTANYAVHNYEDRSFASIIPHTELFLGHFDEEERNPRNHKLVNVDNVLGNFDERLIGYTEEEAQKEAGRCMSCGLCFECDNCVMYCPQDAVFKVKKDESTLGRYVDTDYDKCVGCHICADVCPTGYIQMGLGSD